MADAERGSDEQRANELLVQFKSELRELVTKDAYNYAAHVVITGLLDFAHGMMRRAVRVEPSGAPTLLAQIDLVREGVRVAAAAAPPAPDTASPKRMH